MKTLSIATAVFTSLLATGAMANQEAMQDDDLGLSSTAQGSAMNENHQRANTANIKNDPKTLEQKMENEVQDDWRGDAEERREADVSKPEQR
ncbi:MAG: hypothetical protein CMK99_14950 [Pseudomonas sp.]|jgi:hypothetical protein|uniref:Secreted protein n=1 Tax=Stutzerimonas stutzeri TaxID=316 RepID=A0A5S5BED8_STUST|nr:MULTISPECIES: hypothetical protein [Pseudomonadaceae]MAX92012.1 hypothetical protein [Pseudomonas sp.]MBU0809988.1 hypothetical protein [Gammaproteobacteria bacterium]MBK3847210.1 hypothetical protein [Stutzerimonas xanthomarina]MBU0852268.1 hypothetical protein [Gammaproteobacteria bacterium]TYP65415.1 hypothetical protein A9A72_122550 [Stutzerimonas stutzeri]|tara:strand:+ start:6494 stop:6769 length:276 start_codon:yes stop_codon:yes gene_type:complete